MADKQLEQRNREITELNAEVKAAQYDWLNATDPQRKADLRHVYTYLKEKEERLDSRRAELEAKLPSAGERTLLHPCQQHQALRSPHWSIVEAWHRVMSMCSMAGFNRCWSPKVIWLFTHVHTASAAAMKVTFGGCCINMRAF